VTYTYDANEEDELTLKEDMIITVIEKFPGWWKGEVDGKCGLFPYNYVRPLPSKKVRY
jgi:hypothetical protein